MQTVVDTTGKKGNGKSATEELTPIKDMAQIQLIAVYLTQAMGEPTLEEMQTVIRDELKAKINANSLKRALKGAKRRDIIAINTARVDGGGVAEVHGMKKFNGWKSPPELGHVKNVIAKLMQTPETDELKAMFDAKDADTSGTKIRGNIVDDYHSYTFTAVLITEILGSQIPCPWTDESRKGSKVHVPKRKEEAKKGKKKADEEETEASQDDADVMEGIFMVDLMTGDYIIPSDVMLGWFKTNAARYCGMADSRAEYVTFQPVHIHNPKVRQLVLPINGPRGVSAPKSYECISPGTEFTVHFMAPTKGFLSPDQLEALVAVAGLRPRRGISPARGRRYGKFLVTSFTDHGAIKTSGIDHLKGCVPDEVMKYHGKYLTEAAERLGKIDFTFGAKTKGNGSSDESSPLDSDEE